MSDCLCPKEGVGLRGRGGEVAAEGTVLKYILSDALMSNNMADIDGGGREPTVPAACFLEQPPPPGSRTSQPHEALQPPQGSAEQASFHLSNGQAFF